MSIEKTKFWDVNYYDHPPLTDEMVKEAEKVLQVKLPNQYIELLRVQNGGYTKGFEFPMDKKISRSENHVPLRQLFGIITDSNISTAQNILDSQYMIEEWGLPEKQVLLDGDGHWWLTLDYRKGNVPTITWLDVDNDEDIHVADNFENFLNGLVPDENYAEE